MIDKLYRGVIIFFIAFWIAFIFFDYWQKHPVYYIGFQYFQYWNLLLIYGLIGVAFVAGLHFIRKKKKFLFLTNGLTLYILGLIISATAVQVFLLKTNQKPLTGSNLSTLLGKLIYTSFGTYSTLLVSYVIGCFINRVFPLDLRPRAELLVNIGLGILGLVGVCFVFGIFHLLVWYTLLPTFLIIAGFGWKYSLDFIKRTLINPIKISKYFNTFGAISFYILLIFISLNFMQVNVPFPRGWDALSVYVNLPSLIRDYSGLVQGNQPYNWSLYMSIGYLLFDSIEIVLSISYVGGLLSIAAMYHLCRHWLNMNANFSIFALLVFYTYPSVGFQCYLEQKIDLGLLFILFCILIVLLDWVATYYEPFKKKNSESNVKLSDDYTEDWKSLFLQPHIATMGLLTGLAIGIKLTTLFTIFGIIAVIWYVLKGNNGFLAIFSIGVFIMLSLKMDRVSGLREYHLSVTALTWIMFLAGIGLLFLSFKDDKESFIKGLKISTVYCLFFMLPYLPWLGKNLAELDGKATTLKLINGTTAGPSGNVKTFRDNYQKVKYRELMKEQKKK